MSRPRTRMTRSGSESWREPASPPAPPHAGRRPASSVASAVERVLRESAGTELPSLAPDAEFRSAVREVGRILEADDEALPALHGTTPAEKAVVRLAVDRIRHALLADATTEDAPILLPVLRRLDAIRSAATAARDERLAAQLSGSGALDLVIEVAHDLRSPLTSIMFLSETLRRGQSGPINDVQRQQLGIIYSAALGLVSVANDLMDLARDGDPGALPDFAPEPFSLAETLESVHNMIRPMLEEKRLRLVYNLPTDDIRLGKAFPLHRTLLNLVTNAIKFTDEGHIEVVIRDIRGARVHVSVRDTGRGMDEETVRSIYETFRRGQTRTGYRFSDTGLGMSLCRRMVEVMGGELHVTSEQGKGTRFWFEIDLPPADRGD